MVQGKKAIFLDLDGTLYPYEPCHRNALRAAHAAHRRVVRKISGEVFEQLYRQARDAVHRRLRGQAASHSRLLYFQTLLELEAGRTDVRGSLLLENAYWGAFLDCMRAASWVRPFLRWCKSRGKIVVVVTNLTAGIQMRKLRRLGVEEWVDFLVTSEEAGVEKPAPAIFRIALRKASCRPGQVLVVGNDFYQDCVPFLEFFRV